SENRLGGIDLISLDRSLTHKDVNSNKKIHIYHIRETPEGIQRLPRLVVYVIKVIWQSFMLLLTLLLVKKPMYLLVQLITFLIILTKAVILYDRPASLFKRTDLLTQHKLFCKLAKDYDVFRNELDRTKGATTFTLPLPDGTTIQCTQRPALVMSSTSWTKDEDFSLLLEALEKYDEDRVDDNTDLPDVVCVITGSADIGVCLHKSSSGLDLPMKVVDMFGCGLPVCAVHFNCLDELVKHEHNGLIFRTSEELALQLQDLLRGFPNDCKKLDNFRANIKDFQMVRWDNSWKQTVLPLLD
ncbi:hypothetical protein LSH36_10g12007, partial [Paralvinella palmiformis]